MADISTILIVDDEAKMRNLLSMMLERKGYQIDQATDGKDALKKVSAGTYDLVISDIKMPEMDGKELINRMREQNIVTPVVFITAFATVDSAVDMMRQGAADYVTKPFDESKIHIMVERALNLSRIVNENRELKQALEEKQENRQLIYESNSMGGVVDLVKNVASVDTAVLILGESGTGKEIIARHIHYQSQRSRNRFVPVNCAAISSNLVESELFGYEKGSFTGADSRRRGKFEYATGGTLFLDEIGDMPLDSQGKLLRALQEKKFQRVGGNQEIPVDVRIICATNRNLETMVQQNKFRQDLFYRINVFPISIPPLRQRKEDVVPLAMYLMQKFPFGKSHTISEGACRKLNEYPWPGNVRELANVIERCLILTRETQKITSDTLSFLKPNEPAAGGRVIVKLPPGGVQLNHVQFSLVKQALQAAGNNQTTAAKLLGLSRSKLRVLLKNMDGEQ
ncbi:sigma-54-dependent transcriptional regulator [Desulfobacula toluolica]|uniref:AtoC: acetoacetate metabolism regulatory protein n=1 Tax=Desulfobacula toluolica (strain DSM 7467 / Tol2) TaxID=651182 RepID=K0N6E9_DESTT|nr:sigma-54 dependent transcriptional regulator [Desulfobacula toluolica]CCK79559.1 AtoC: acetoacetate metabolism regulatory protein [Desulfobacula toluolica Tol2]